MTRRHYSPSTIALTGATSATGFAFLKTMLARYPRLKAVILVTAQSRGFKTARFQKFLARHDARISIVHGDLADLHLSRREERLLIQTDGGLWHFAAQTSPRSRSREAGHQVRRVNVSGTARLLAMMSHAASSAPFFLVSTAFVAGRRNGTVLESELNEDQSFHSVYAASRMRAEEHVRAAFAQGLAGAIFRPGVVVTNRPSDDESSLVDLCASAVANAIRSFEPRFIFRFPADAGLNLVHEGWVVEAMIALAARARPGGTTYHLTAPDDTSLLEIGRTIQWFRPDFPVMVDPSIPRVELTSSSRTFDRAVERARAYFSGGIVFDRANTDRDLPARLRRDELDLPAFVHARLDAAGIPLLISRDPPADLLRTPAERMLAYSRTSLAGWTPNE